MRLGLALPHYPFSFPTPQPSIARRAIEYARLAEDAGFQQVWVSDHFWVDVAAAGRLEQRQQPAECWTLLAAIAATTTRVRIGSLATPVGFRNPNLLARMAATVHGFAAGRLDVALGAGWNESEYRANGLAFPPAGQRLASLADTVHLLQQQAPGVPVWVAGKRPKLLEVAATADGWNTAWDTTMAEYQHRDALLRQACHRGGRDPATVRRSLGLTTLIGRDNDDLERRWRRLQRWAPGDALTTISLRQWSQPRLVGTPTEVAQQLRRWDDTGVEQVICSFGAPFAVHDDEQLELATDTMALLDSS
ncbi:LLM class flavin-dependent oxidoreductase [Micromonospora thermarum]|uniref:LLM class flavin-dependent oxidoreductase n=1 Tax=Micromonospora thermarum TaxID=2720024 RepID=A0ABX0Z8H5_9ACTN|nr:LLM class flavin-dependent oxidoreductase [Micromonospora thermarum]NJP34167.1 LLM class flavin-dependent oxidoreductase [Micromonospora thermarum]